MGNFYLITVTLLNGTTKTYEGRLNYLSSPDEDGRAEFKKLIEILDGAESIGLIEGYRITYES